MQLSSAALLLSAVLFSPLTAAYPVQDVEYYAVAATRRGINGGPSSFDTGFSYYTSSDGSSLIRYNSTDMGVFNVQAPANSPSVAIDLTTTYQPIDGVGVAITDAACYNMQQGKSSNSGAYGNFLAGVFDQYTGLSVIRVPIGATDFSQSVYTLADKTPTINPVTDPVGAMAQVFDSTNAANNVVPCVRDILSARSNTKIILTSWSGPAWMKVNQATDLNGFNGGNLKPGYDAVYAEYVAQTVKAYYGANIPIYAVTTQNEPSFNASYPSMYMDATQQNKVAGIIKRRLSALGYGSVKVWTHDDNLDQWQSAAKSVTTNSSNVDGVGFHSYAGDPSQIANFISAVPNKEIHYTEGSAHDANGTLPEAIGYWSNRIFGNLTLYNVRSYTTWNFMLRNNGPRLSSAYCTNCQGSVTYNGGISVTYQALYYAAQHFAAVTANTGSVSGGGPAVRVASTPSANANGCLTTRAFAAPYSNNRKRVGLQLVNACNVTAPIVISAGTTKVNYNVQSGLHSIVFLANP